ncbi:class I adenylate cyclase [Alginatibacterium sediminis]|uniref:Adenylate cyclase n=1 Tax=Alginatibacterium sediminis TaxID=2164068 RepID=A0A420EN20_9ALTE|nr:class I adenylate cyclase [Alginatibacterium sediminis]RKF22112.1 class I adenylate cyclase [Alginatibacterium sediminis]
MQNQIDSLRALARESTTHRKQLALQIMPAPAQRVFELLPLLLHYHHPSLPGFFAAAVPSGIHCFETSARHYIYLSQHFTCNPEPSVKSEILGLYSMGSTASLGQSVDSDLDMWVCHADDLPAHRVELLASKCDLISEWAQHQGVELSFFMVSEQQFKSGAISQLSKDNCGSAQHLLLLDEFYRTALPLAGKQLVWHCVPAEAQGNYDAFVEQQFATGIFNDKEWLDLGGLDQIPAEEYFGSALWQLYKGIDSPYKAVLKTLLMEAYSADYPNTKILAVQQKELAQNGSVGDLNHDPYYLMLETVTSYLTRIGDQARLDLVRRCFFLKNKEIMVLPQRGQRKWQQQFIYQLIESWEWDQDKIKHLSRRSHWKATDVKKAHAELIDALMLSYRNLIRFARQNNISESINPEDIGILSRKLYAAFESLPGKVTLINPQISPNLNESDLSYIHVPDNHSCRAGWYLYKQSMGSTQMIGEKALEHSPYLSKLVAWSYFNELYSPVSRLHMHAPTRAISPQTLERFCNDLKQAFPVNYPSASNIALTRPCEIRHLGIFINFEKDPTASWAGKVIEFDAHTTDVLAFGRQQDCLIESIDLVYRNSWNEIRTLNFDGPSCVVDALTTVMGKMHRDANAPDHIDVFCYSQYFDDLIEKRFRQLLVECIEHRLHLQNQKVVKTLVLGKDKYGIFFENRGVTVKKLENAIEFYSQISNNKLQRLPLQLNAGDRKNIPAIVDAQASEGLVQYFFENHDTGFNIYIVDEQNRVEVYQDFDGSKEELVQGINRFYTSSREQYGQKESAINFNLPQFYDIVMLNHREAVEPYRSESNQRAS